MSQNKIILFGNGKIADVLFYYFKNHSEYEVVAITVDHEFMGNSNSWNGLPLISFDQIETKFPCQNHKMFIAVGYQNLNRLRESKFNEAKKKGYKLISYVHPNAGLPIDCRLGENCFVMQNSMVHPRVTLGNNVFVWSGAMIGHHSKIGDHCWLTSGCNVSGNVTMGSNCFLAVNSTIAHSVKIGLNCFIGANSLITKCTDNSAVYLENSTKPFRLNSNQFLKISEFDLN
jgi:sugar O-acyltransferase (sialic acid O-acetyltransferase NeuD family)